MNQDFVTVARWSGGYELRRVVTSDGYKEIQRTEGSSKTFNLHEATRLFALYHNGKFVLRFSANPGARVSIWGFGEDPLSLEVRAVVISAIFEVLEAQMTPASSASKPGFSFGLSPYVMRSGFVSTCLAAEKKHLYRFSANFRDVGDGSLGGLQIQYQHTASDLLSELRLDSLSRMFKMVGGGLAGYRITPAPNHGASSFGHSSVIIGTGEYKLAIVLSFDFRPEPQWGVRIMGVSSWGRPDFKSKQVWLSNNEPGPLAALLRSSLVVSTDRLDQDYWLGPWFDMAPELEAAYDISPYLMVGVESPLQWRTDRFMDWCKELGPIKP